MTAPLIRHETRHCGLRDGGWFTGNTSDCTTWIVDDAFLKRMFQWVTDRYAEWLSILSHTRSYCLSLNTVNCKSIRRYLRLPIFSPLSSSVTLLILQLRIIFLQNLHERIAWKVFTFVCLDVFVSCRIEAYYWRLRYFSSWSSLLDFKIGGRRMFILILYDDERRRVKHVIFYMLLLDSVLFIIFHDAIHSYIWLNLLVKLKWRNVPVLNPVLLFISHSQDIVRSLSWSFHRLQ